MSYCGEEIHSRTNHYYKYCKCEFLTVDRRYDDGEIWKAFRIIGEVGAETRIIEIDVTENKLYEDWNNSEDEYGTYGKKHN